MTDIAKVKRMKKLGPQDRTLWVTKEHSSYGWVETVDVNILNSNRELGDKIGWDAKGRLQVTVIYAVKAAEKSRSNEVVTYPLSAARTMSL